jgi:hypothetical protein
MTKIYTFFAISVKQEYNSGLAGNHTGLLAGLLKPLLIPAVFIPLVYYFVRTLFQ